jgi:predicted GNAT family acetyltransferase
MQSEIAIREYQPADESFVFSSWLNSYQKNSPATEAISKYVFFKFHHPILTRILKRETTEVTIACLKDDPEVVIGYLAIEKLETPPAIIHFCYVKSAFRRMGIARKLMESSDLNPNECHYTHHTHPVDWWISRMFPKLSYNPYAV